MDELFELPVEYNGQMVAFPARLLQLGYTHKFAVDINGNQVYFEPDEEQHYRAVTDLEQMEEKKEADKELLKAIAGAIEAVVT